MRFNTVLAVLNCFLITYTSCFCQNENYYLFPVQPGEQNFLAGTMGEMRGTHFHAGIDIKTGGVIGYPIYAAADGYISRIKVTSNGYGNALYIAHPNGQTTLYGHLDSFKKEIADFVRNEQYRRESFTINIFPDASQFPVRKGEVIASGGNSGGSTGPHLHFEIRDINQNVLNPLGFNFQEIIDTIPPVLKKLIIIPLNINSRVDGVFERKEYTIEGSKNKYYLPKTINLKGSFGFAILAYDRLNGVRNRNGIKYFELQKDGKPIFKHDINKLSFARMSSIKSYMDYPEKYFSNRKINKLYIDDGNDLRIYDRTLGTGTISLNDNLQHSFRLNAVDAYGNQSTLRFKSKLTATSLKDTPKYDWKVYGNTMKIVKPKTLPDSTMELFIKGVPYQLSPAYTSDTHRIYLWNLQEGLPDYLDFCDGNDKKKTHFIASIFPDEKKIINHDKFKLVAMSQAVFDTLHLQFKYEMNQNQEYFQFMQPEFPSKKNLTLSLKVNTDMHKKENYSVYTVNAKGNYNYMGGEWVDSKTISFKTKVLEKFTIASDTISPTIKVIRSTADEVRFKMKDDLSGIQAFKAILNGEFLLLEHRHKLGYVRSIKKNKNIPLAGQLIISVTDNAGNQTIIERKI